MSLPDLPGLESVESKSGGGCNPIFGCGLLIFFPVFGIASHIAWYGILASIIVTLGVNLLYYYLTDITYATSPDGIQIKRKLGSTVIPWTNIRRASFNPIWPSSEITLETQTGKRIKVTAPPVLEASIWQHLRRIGRADNARLSEEALSIWAPIPDDIPYEMELGSYGIADSGFSSFKINSEPIETVPSESLHRELRPTSIYWSEVTDASWMEENGDEEIWLYIFKGQDKTILSLSANSLEAARFFLAALRMLRKLDHIKPLTIPARYRQLCGIRITDWE